MLHHENVHHRGLWRASDDGRSDRSFHRSRGGHRRSGNLVRRSALGRRFTRFEVIEESPEFEGDMPEIISESEGPYEKSP